MRRLTLKELQKIELDILIAFDKVCSRTVCRNNCGIYKVLMPGDRGHPYSFIKIVDARGRFVTHSCRKGIEK